MSDNFEILNSFVDLISIVNQKGEIVFTNSVWKKNAINNSGDPNKTDVGANYLKICDEVIGLELDDARKAAKGIKSIIDRKSNKFELEYPCHSPNEEKWFILRVSPHETNDALTIISHIDITKRKLSEQEIKIQNQKNKIINERLNITLLRIVHDIQNPISSIEGLVELTKINDESQKVSPYFALIETSITNLKNFIQETLEISSSGIFIESINFKDLVQDFFDSIKYLSTLNNTTIEININQFVEFYSDKKELLTIISNIINNSLKYCDPNKNNKKITITIDINESEASLSIIDNGIGMKEAIISKIFRIDFQANKKTSAGSGVGLHLVKKSIQQLKGSIKVNSTFGIGTEFILIIPTMKKI